MLVQVQMLKTFPAAGKMTQQRILQPNSSRVIKIYLLGKTQAYLWGKHRSECSFQEN